MVKGEKEISRIREEEIISPFHHKIKWKQLLLPNKSDWNLPSLLFLIKLLKPSPCLQETQKKPEEIKQSAPSNYRTLCIEENGDLNYHNNGDTLNPKQKCG